MDNIYWVIVANTNQARIYSSKNPLKKLDLLEEFEHPDSRKLDHDLTSDGPGHYKAPNASRGIMQPRSNPHKNEHEIFARQLASVLHSGRVANKFHKLVVIAEPHFYGLLAKNFDKSLKELISQVIQKDYYFANERELIEFIQANE